MKVKTSDLIGPELDWAVSKAIGEYRPTAVPAYSADWGFGGPIIEREEIGTYTQYPRVGALKWYGRRKGSILGIGPTPLIAAMRCFVASKLGDEVEMPDDLI